MSTLKIGQSSPVVPQLKEVLHAAGYWADADFSPIVTGELLYWIREAAVAELLDSEKNSTSAILSTLKGNLTKLTGATTSPTAIPAPELIVDGKVNPLYVVPDAVVRFPDRVYGSLDAVELVVAALPFKLALSWDLKTEVMRLSVNRKMITPLNNAMCEMLETFGHGLIGRLGLNITGGCYNKRKVRGGSNWSSHSWGVAIDINPSANRMGAAVDKTLFGTDKRYQKAAKILYKYGFRTYGHDLQHWQWIPSQYL